MNKGAPASPSGSRASHQAELHRPDPSGFDPSRFAFAFLTEQERRFIAATPRQQLADAAHIAKRAGDRSGGLRLAGFARRYPWLFQRQASKVNGPARNTFCLDYRLSKEGAAVAEAIATEARRAETTGSACEGAGGEAVSPETHQGDSTND